MTAKEIRYKVREMFFTASDIHDAIYNAPKDKYDATTNSAITIVVDALYHLESLMLIEQSKEQVKNDFYRE